MVKIAIVGWGHVGMGVYEATKNNNRAVDGFIEGAPKKIDALTEENKKIDIMLDLCILSITPN